MITRIRHLVAFTFVSLVAAVVPLTRARCQLPSGDTASVLSLDEAQRRALRFSPVLAAAREAQAAAVALERQAGAFPNPTLSIQREQTGSGTVRNSQTISSVDQPIEIGLRAARRRAAGFRREAAEQRARDAEQQVAFEVAVAYARVVSADRRAALGATAAAAFERARRAGDERLAGGDISGYEARRIRLESARYAILSAEAHVARYRARLALAALIAPESGPLDPEALRLMDPAWSPEPAPDTDALVRGALADRADLRAARADADAARADAALTARERLPVPVFTAGLKNEEVGGTGELNGIAVGVAIPLPLWDRRAGALSAANAVALGRDAESAQLARRVEGEVRAAVAALLAVDHQLNSLTGLLDADAERAVRAAEIAHSEGELTLLEWLDAVRAHQEAAAALADLFAESIIRRSALVRAAGLTPSR